MIGKRLTQSALLAVFAAVMAAGADRAAALSSSFTYQGQLHQSGSTVSDNCDFQFSLWSAASGGSQIGSTQYVNSVPVVNGLFTTALDFGHGYFTGDDRWLEIAVRCPQATGGFTTLNPRQFISATPYALFAPTAGSATELECTGCVNSADIAAGAVTSSHIAPGTISTSNLAFTPGTVTSILTGPGLTGGTITTSGTISADIGTTPGTVAAGDHNHDERYWSVVGNADTGRAIFGTTDASPLNIVVNNEPAFRLVPTGNSPNVIGGYGLNDVMDGVIAATIAGGGGTMAGNQVTDNFGTVGGGNQNRAGDHAGTTADRPFATVAGGSGNVASGTNSSIGGGNKNTASGSYGALGGGSENVVDGEYSTIGGGRFNQALAAYTTIAGGGPSEPTNATTGNRVTDDYGTIGGGGGNKAGNESGTTSDATYATVAGGGGNTAGGLGSSVGGGGFNWAAGNFATVPGGTLNVASGVGSFAAGQQALAVHDGSFVWGDGTAPAGSQGANTFNALATGGFRFYFSTTGHCDLISTTGWQCSSASDRAVKSDFATVNGRDVLARVAAMPIQTWAYKSGVPSVRHIGPMAQDFFAAFEVGENYKEINTVDADGVALAAIQGLYAIVQEKDADLAALREQNAALEARIDALERAIGRIVPSAPVAATAWNAPQQ